jgi:hypothetical protein
MHLSNLVIQNNNNTEPLSKSAKKFNQLLLRLQKAENKLTLTRDMLDTKLMDCMKLVQPTFDEWCVNKSDLIIALAQYIASTEILWKNREYIVTFAIQTLQEVRFSPHQISDEKRKSLADAAVLLDPEMVEILEVPSALSHSEEGQREEKLEMTKEFIKSQLEMVGIDIDLSDIHASMSDDEIAAALDERISAADPNYKQAKPKKKSKAKVKKEMAQAEFNALKDKSFSSMYKNLVKLIHPDAEADETLKLKKTEWMQQLTVAYKNKDIKKMMLIELEWLHGSKEQLEKMSEDKLAHFNQLLSDQIKETEMSESMLFGDPRYYPLLYFANGAHNIKRFNPYQCREEIKRQNLEDMTDLESLQAGGKPAKAVIANIVKEMKAMEKLDFSW